MALRTQPIPHATLDSAACPRCGAFCQASDAEVVRGVLWMRCPTCLEMFDGTWSEVLEDAEPTQQMVPEQASGLVFVRTPFGPKLVDSAVSQEPTVSVPVKSTLPPPEVRARSTAPSQRPTAPPSASYEELEIPVPSAAASEREARIEEAIASALFLKEVEGPNSRPLSVSSLRVERAPRSEPDPITSLEVETRVLGYVPPPARARAPSATFIIVRPSSGSARRLAKLAFACLLMALVVVLGGLALRRASSLLGEHAHGVGESSAASG